MELTYISIHAPTRGATLSVYDQIHIIMISIHAPTRGATNLDFVGEDWGVDFNPRPHTGSDISVWSWHTASHYNFNPRPHTGSDSKNDIFILLFSIFY